LNSKYIKKIKWGEKLMRGIAASPGVAMGKVCIHRDIFSHVSVRTIEDHQIGVEIQRLKRAIEAIEESIRKDKERIRSRRGQTLQDIGKQGN
jgi:phosphotransferase system enzyme I (PtsI)